MPTVNRLVIKMNVVAPKNINYEINRKLIKINILIEKLFT